MIEARSASWLAPHGPLSKINRTLKTATILEDASALLVPWLLGLSSPYSVHNHTYRNYLIGRLPY